MKRLPSKPLCAHCGQPKPKGRGRRLCDPCSKAWLATITGNPCLRCGEPCEYHQQLCADCKELATWRHSKRRHGLRAPCVRCGRPKRPGRGQRYCDACKAKNAKPAPCRICGLRPRRYRGAQLCQYCSDTTSTRRREYRRLYALTHPEPPRSGRRVHPETRRISRRVVAERDGRPMPEVSPEVYAERYGPGLKDLVDAAPLLAFAGQFESLNQLLDPGDYDAIRHARHKGRLTLAVADRVITALDGRLAYVYPDLDFRESA